MEWKKAISEKVKSHHRKNGSNFAIRKIRVGFRKGGLIILSYIKRNTIRSHIIELPFKNGWRFPRHVQVSGLLVMSLLIPVLGFTMMDPEQSEFDKVKSNLATQGNATPGVGGTGDVKASADHQRQSEKDEKLKDDLLKLEEDPFPSKTDEAGSIFKREYIVKKGDTLSEISKNFNVSQESIAGSSQLQLLDSLRIGQRLLIPSKEGFFYTVRKGERLAKILKKYKVNLDEFQTENNELNIDLLQVGQEVFLPNAKPDNIIRSWLIPVGSRIITSSFGWRTYPRRAFHKGIDLKAAYTRVRAAKSGRVTYAGRLGGYGKVIIISHSGGYKTLYAHLSKLYVRKGNKVMQGIVIAKSGNTGYSTGAHLHFEISRRGKHINPSRILTGLKHKRKRRRRRR